MTKQNLKKLTELSQEYGLYDTIPQEIQDLMPEKRKRDAISLNEREFDIWSNGQADGYNQALTEVEAVLPQMLALAEKRGAEKVGEEVRKVLEQWRFTSHEVTPTSGNARGYEWDTGTADLANHILDEIGREILQALNQKHHELPNRE